MSARIKILNKFFIFIAIFLCSFLSAFAVENSLLGIDVKQTGDSDYKVLLKADMPIDIQKEINLEGELTLVLKETLPTDSVEIIYDNAQGLENVILQKKNNGDTVVFLQGKNIENAKVFTKDLSSGSIIPFNEKQKLLFDVKTVGIAIVGLILLLMMIPSSKSKNKKQNINVKNVKKSKNQSNYTLRNKIQAQKATVPSINYNVNTSFKSHMSTPKEFVINNYLENEQVRKAG